MKTYYSALIILNLWGKMQLHRKLCNKEKCLSLSLSPSLSCTWHLLRPPWTSLFSPSAPLPPLPHSPSSPTYSTGAHTLTQCPTTAAGAAGGLPQFCRPPTGGIGGQSCAAPVFMHAEHITIFLQYVVCILFHSMNIFWMQWADDLLYLAKCAVFTTWDPQCNALWWSCDNKVAYYFFEYCCTFANCFDYYLLKILCSTQWNITVCSTLEFRSEHRNSLLLKG